MARRLLDLPRLREVAPAGAERGAFRHNAKIKKPPSTFGAFPRFAGEGKAGTSEFSFANTLPAPYMIVDAVIPWVDGSDPAHRQRLEACLERRGGSRPAAASTTRFHDAGELDWCVASILRFAPWLRHIHIVTDAQTPALIARLRGTPHAARVRVVDHREMRALPDMDLEPRVSEISPPKRVAPRDVRIVARRKARDPTSSACAPPGWNPPSGQCRVWQGRSPP